jgi:sugar phosphate isomerase/epimerase
MNHCLSTHLFANHRLTTVWLEKTWQAGIPWVEIFCTRQHLDWRDRTQVRDVAAWFRDSELKVHSVHSPLFTDDVWGRSGPNAVLTITEPDKAKRVGMVGEIKRALELAESIPFRYLIQHVGVAYEEYDERKVEAAFGALEEISLFARQRGVEVLLENIPNDLSSAERLQLFLQTTHLKLGYCFDVGHAHMGEGVERAFSLMKELIRSTHVHDNNGSDDRHLFPLTAAGGTLDWKKTMELLRSRQDQYPLLLELREVPEMPHPIDEASRVFEELEKL